MTGLVLPLSHSCLSLEYDELKRFRIVIAVRVKLLYGQRIGGRWGLYILLQNPSDAYVKSLNSICRSLVLSSCVYYYWGPCISYELLQPCLIVSNSSSWDRKEATKLPNSADWNYTIKLPNYEKVDVMYKKCNWSCRIIFSWVEILPAINLDFVDFIADFVVSRYKFD